MDEDLSRSARKVQQVLQTLGLACEVTELPGSTRSAAEAAQAIGCRVEQIAKSLVFRGQQSDKPILVIASGVHRVNETRLGQLVGEQVAKADAEFVRRRTGFVIGGVPPVGHTQRLETYIDEALMRLDEIWAAAGTPHAVFRLTPAELQTATEGRIIAVV